MASLMILTTAGPFRPLVPLPSAGRIFLNIYSHTFIVQCFFGWVRHLSIPSASSASTAYHMSTVSPGQEGIESDSRESLKYPSIELHQDDRVAIRGTRQGPQEERYVLFLRLPTGLSSNMRLGTRSVSSLTPAQLARKRANDREAQRAIRARTKEHIERLERELDEVKRSREELFRQNEALRNEVRELATINQALMPGRPYPTPGTHPADMFGYPSSQGFCHSLDPGYNVDGLTPAVSGVPSRASSLGQSSGDFGTTAPGYGTSYLPTPESCGDSWSSIIQVPAHSVVSSPCSSTAHPDDYATGYTPTSMPASMMTSSVIPAENITSLDESKMEFGDINSGEETCAARRR